MSKTRTKIVIAAAALLGLIAPLALTAAMPAAAAGVMSVTIEPIDPISNTPQTWAGYASAAAAQTNLGYRVSYSCSVEACDNTTIALSPGPLDPTYGTYRHLVFSTWTAPFVGATITGNDTAGRVVNLGNLAAGASGSFQVVYSWAAIATSVTPAQFYGNGFQINWAATATSSTVPGSVVANAAPVAWQTTVPTPGLSMSGATVTDSGVEYTYSITMSALCTVYRDTAHKGDSHRVCAKSYDVVQNLPAEATFVSASNGGSYDAGTNTVSWSKTPAAGVGEPAIGWGRYNTSYNYYYPRTVTVRFDAQSFSPTSDPDYCDFSQAVSSTVNMTMTYIGATASDNSNVKTSSSTVPTTVSCISPFAKGTFLSKASTYDGPNSIAVSGVPVSPIVVQSAPSLNEHFWSISVGNQANVPGVAIIEDTNLAITGTRPYRIESLTTAAAIRPTDSIAWTLNDGTTGTSTVGFVDAPTGKWFTSMVVTTAPLAGPNLYSTGTASTQQVSRIYYRVAETAPVGSTVYPNTAHATMTYPGYPTLSTLDLGTKTWGLQYYAPFGRGTLEKTGSSTTTSGGELFTTLPTSGTAPAYWSLIVRNTGNVPGVAVIDDANLDGKPSKVTSLTAVASSGNVATGATVQYTLNTGATGTSTVPFTAPTGTWITSVHVTTPTINPSTAGPSQTTNSSYFELRLNYTLSPTTTGDWTNTASATLTYPGMGVATVNLGSSTKVQHLGSDNKARITAGFVGTPVVEGGGQAVPGRNVTYQVRAVSSNQNAAAVFTPQYVFIAPDNWKIMPNGASFAAGTVPAGVTFTYKSVVIGGVTRQAVVATWPAGTTFGVNTTWPAMTVVTQPTSAAAPGVAATAIAYLSETSNNWTTAQAVYATAGTDTLDIDGDGLTTDGYAGVTSAAVTVGAASQFDVSKQICSPNAAQADGCDWIIDPGSIVGVDPGATNIRYRIILTNAGNTPLTNVVAYDVLPFVGDTGTSAATAGSPRGSTFAEALDSVSNLSGVTVSYSDSTNPCRPEVYTGGPAGCTNDWSAASGDATGAKALKITASAALAPGASVSLQYTASVVSGAGADAIACNSVAVKASEVGVATEPPAVCATTQEADLALAVPSRLPLQVNRPGVLPYTVTNKGGSAFSGATVDVAIPAGVQVTSLTPTGWTCVSSSASLTGPITLTCTATTLTGAERTLAKDAPDALTIAIVPTTASSLCIDGDASGRMADPDATNNDATACFTVLAAGGVTIDKDDARTSVSAGEEYTYTLTIANTLVGEPLTAIAVTDTLPAGLEFVSASDGGTESGGVVTWPAFDLAKTGSTSSTGTTTTGAGATTTRTVTVRVALTATGDIVNTAHAAVADPIDAAVTLEDTATDTDGLRRLTISKTTDAPAAGIVAGQEVTYTVVLTNAGTAAYTSGSPATLRDVLGGVLDDATFVTGSAQVSVDGAAAVPLADPVGGTLSWSGALGAGKSVVVTYTVSAVVGGDQRLVNIAFSSVAASCDAATGVASDGAACAVTSTPFAPKVSKTVQSFSQGDDGLWTIVYAIDIANPNTDNAVTYSLADTLRFGAGITVSSASVSVAPAGVSPAAWSGSGSIAAAAVMPAGSQHHYEVTVVANAGSVIGTPAASCATGVASGFANTIVLKPVGGDQQTAEACESPSAPTITKSASAPIQNPDGTWNVVYSITATGSPDAPAAGLAYSITDAFAFPAGVAVQSVAVSGPAGAPVNAGFNGTSATALLSSPDRVGASATRTFTVTVTTSVPAQAVGTTAAACAPAGSGGYANAATLLAGVSSTVLGTDDACVAVVTQPTPTIDKKVTSTSIDAVSGDWTIAYQVTVANPSASYATVYDLDDELQFGDGITVVSAAVASADATVLAGWNGVGTTAVVADAALPAGASHVYTVTVSATPPTVIDSSNEAAMDCRLDTGETGTGFRNVASFTSGSADGFAVGCEAASDPSVVKTTVGAPTQNATTGVWTAEYQITVTNRSTSTIVGGVPYSLVDTFGFPAGTVVSSLAVSGPGTVNSSFDGVTDTALATGAITAAVDDLTPRTHVYTVSVQYTVPAGLTTAALACDVAQGTGGMRNEVEIGVGVRTTADVACVDAPEAPIMGVTKSVLSQQQQADGTWVVLYRVAVANPSAVVAGRYDLEDEFDLGAGIALVGTPSVVAAPAGVTVNHGTWNGGTDATVSENILLGAGATHSYTVRAVVDAGSVRGSDAAGDCTLAGGESGTGFSNGASVTSGTADRSASACVTAFDPAVSKTVNGVPVRNADGSWTVSYVITVDNPSATVGLAYGMDDELDFPAGTTFASAVAVARAGGPATSSSWNGVSDLVVVPAGTSLPAGGRHVFDVTVVATLPASQGSLAGGWANTAAVESGTSGVVVTSTGAAADIELPELEVRKTVSAVPVVRIGDTVTYTVTVENTGDGDFTTRYPAELWDDLSGVLDDGAVAGSPAVAPAIGAVSTVGSRLHWSGALGAGQSVDITYSVTVTADGDLSLDNVAFAGEPGTTPATPAIADCTGDDCAFTSTALPGFLIEKSASVGVVQPGGQVTYTVVYTNTGTVDVGNASFTDDLTAVLDDGSLTAAPVASSGTVGTAGAVLTWTGALDAGDSVTVTYAVDVTSPASGDGAMTNTATMDPRFAPLCPAGSATCTSPQRSVDVLTSVRALAFTKTASSTLATYGQTITYTVTVTNISATAYTAGDPAVVVDSMGAFLDDAVYNGDAHAATGTITASADEIQWSGPLAAGATETFEYTVRINDTKTGDGRLGNIIGLAGTRLPTSAFTQCDPAAVGNAGEFCFVSVAISPLAFTGVSIELAIIVAMVLLLLGLILLGVKNLRRTSSAAHRKA